MTRLLIIAAYITAIVVANVITASTTPADIGPFLITWGTWIVGVTFILRDVMQLAVGRGWAYAAILVALAVSALASALLGDTLAIVAGSAAAFALSETADTEVFTRLKARIPLKVAVSGVVGGILDSAVFAVIGLSPLWSGIVPWGALPNLILGQIVVKALLQLAAASLWRASRGPELLPAGAA